MYTYVYIYVCVCVCVYIYIYILQTYICTYISHTHTHTHAHTSTYKQGPPPSLAGATRCGNAAASACDGALPPFSGISAGGRAPVRVIDPQPTVHAHVTTYEPHLAAGIGSCVMTHGGGVEGEGAGEWNNAHVPEAQRNFAHAKHPAYYYLDNQVGPCGNSHYLHTHLLAAGGVHATYYSSSHHHFASGLPAPAILTDNAKQFAPFLGIGDYGFCRPLLSVSSHRRPPSLLFPSRRA